jgi:hypothetical protein
MKKYRCMCWSCVLGRAFHRARWLFTRTERKRIDDALCYAIEQEARLHNGDKMEGGTP